MHPARALVLVLAAAATDVTLRAQCYEPQTGPSIGVGFHAVLPMQALGFAFPFGGTTYTHVHPTTDGFVYLSNSGVPAPGTAPCCASEWLLVAGSPKICAYWNYLFTITGTGSVKFSALPGKAVITWENVLETMPPEGGPFTVQMQLHATGEIDFSYDARCVATSVGSHIVGMSEGNGAALVGTLRDFSAAGVSTTTTNCERFDFFLPFDLTGLTLRFVPAGFGYAWSSSPCASIHTSYGSGCYSEFASFYESLPGNAFDLANSSMSMLLTGDRYTVLPGVATYIAPSAAATVLPLAFGSQATVALSSPLPYPGGTTNTLAVCEDGGVSVGAAGYCPGGGAPSLLLSPHPAFASGHDFDVTVPGSGRIKFEEVGGVACITWDGVYSAATTSPNTLQFQFDLATGHVHFVWGAVSTVGSHLVGYSPGGPSEDPGPIDISVALLTPFTTYPTDLLPLALSASPAPVRGTTVTYATKDIPAYLPTSGTYIAVHILSLGQIPAPGLDLGFLGAPGCAALAQIDHVQAMIGASATQSVTFTVPVSAPIGLQVFSQSAALIAPNSLMNGANALGMTTSNGLISYIGAW